MSNLEPLAVHVFAANRAVPMRSDADRLLDDLEETEALLRLPDVQAHIDKAKRLALSIARRGPKLVPHQAMLLLSAIGDQQRAEPDAPSRIQSALSDLRAALGAPLKPKPLGDGDALPPELPMSLEVPHAGVADPGERARRSLEATRKLLLARIP